MSNIIYLNVRSTHSWKHIGELADEVYSQQIAVFEHKIGEHMPLWRTAKIGDHIVYNIDDIALCGGEISFIKSKAFRPKWLPDNRDFKIFVDFAQSMACESLSKNWAKYMINQHVEAIEKHGKWLFAVFAIIRPMYHYAGNKSIIYEKVKDVVAYEEEQARISSPFFMGDMINE
jgi:hypothetical protein